MVDFSIKIKRQFGPSQFEDHQSRLFKLTQTHTSHEFISQFEKLRNKVIGISKSQLLSCFIGGLKSSLSIEVRLAKPETILEATDLAKEYEARTNDIQHERNALTHPAWRVKSWTPATPSNLLTGPVKEADTNRINIVTKTTKLETEKKTLPFKKLTWKQQQE